MVGQPATAPISYHFRPPADTLQALDRVHASTSHHPLVKQPSPRSSQSKERRECRDKRSPVVTTLVCFLFATIEKSVVARLRSASRTIGRSRGQDIQTHCVPVMPIACAAPRAKSSVTPRVNGPRSLIVTVTDLPFSGLVTVTCDPKGSERCAAVKPPELKAWPLAVRRPET